MQVSVGVSARHVHLTKDDVKVLFGSDYVLTKKCDLSQKGQYACNEKVTIMGPKKSIENVRVLAPERSNTQVEVSKTDAFLLGIDPPVRNSGDLNDASLITIIGPKGQITKKAAIIAARHIHVSTIDAKKYNLQSDKFVSLLVKGEKGGILNNVYVRISDDFSFEVHLDTDDANAFLIKNGDKVELIED